MRRFVVFVFALLLMACTFSASTLAQALAPERERALKPKDSFKECDRCPVMVAIPLGSFTMGSPESEKDRIKNEGPQHQVTFARPFAVGKFEVTVDQFAAFVADTGYDAGSNCIVWQDGKWNAQSGHSWRNPGFSQNDSHPVVCVTWNDTKAYVAWLSKKTGKTYRLLTEAEWEYAARAGTTTRYNFGDDGNAMCRHGNGADQTAKSSDPGASGWATASCSDGYAYTAPVGRFSANAFGLHDIHGNVWEQTEDCWNENYTGAPRDGSAWTSGDCRRHVVRSGSWWNLPQILRAAMRDGPFADARGSFVGFRVGRTLNP